MFDILKLPAVFRIALAFVLAFNTSCSFLPLSSVAGDAVSQIEGPIFDEPEFDIKHDPVLNDTQIENYLVELLAKGCSHTGIRHLHIRVANTLNAQASSFYADRLIVISKGFLLAIKNEAQLMGVISHEIGHFYAQLHPKKKSKVAEFFKEMAGNITESGLPDGARSELDEIQQAQFQKGEEQKADEFGALLLHQLGYDPYAFADLFEQLSQHVENKALATLRSLKGSHKTLSDRAEHLRKFLASHKIPKGGVTGQDAYLKHLRHLGRIKITPSYTRAQQTLDRLLAKYSATKKQAFSVKEFLAVMTKIRMAAKDLGILAQFAGHDGVDAGATAHFLSQKVKITGPWWRPADPNVAKVKHLLANLSRFAVGAIPFVGDAVDLYGLLAGKDFVTGRHLSFGERFASGLGVLVGSGKEWSTVASGLEEIEEKSVTKVVKAAEEAIEDAPLLPGVEKAVTAEQELNPEVIHEIERTYRPIKNAKNYEILKKLAKKTQDAGIPDNWAVKVSKIKPKKEQGLEYVNPDNSHVRVRVMPGNPRARFSNSRKPYVRQTDHGRSYDLYGNPVEYRSDEAHIPLENYKFMEFWKHGK